MIKVHFPNKLRLRKTRHRVYLENRIRELHKQISQTAIYEGKIDEISRKLILKYRDKNDSNH